MANGVDSRPDDTMACGAEEFWADHTNLEHCNHAAFERHHRQDFLFQGSSIRGYDGFLGALLLVPKKVAN
jgi:hypothetical protein